MMLKSMRSTVNESGLFGDDFGRKMYTEMLDDEYAKQIGADGSLGLTDLILKQLRESDPEIPDIGALKALKYQSLMGERGFAPPAQSSVSNPQALFEKVRAWDGFIEEASRKFGVDKTLVSSVIAQESAGNPYAVSRAGAKGLMQIMDSTAQDLKCARVLNPRENILAGTQYLRQLLDRFNNDEKLALASYNAGPSAVERHGGIPPYAETQDYVERVLAIRARFATMAEAAKQGGTDASRSAENGSR